MVIETHQEIGGRSDRDGWSRHNGGELRHGDSRRFGSDHFIHKMTAGRQILCNAVMTGIIIIAAFASALLANRGQPLEFAHNFIKPEKVYAGGSFTAYFVTKTVTKECPGIVHRAVVDSEGTTWPLPSGPLSYWRDGPKFGHTFQLDDRVSEGPAVYRARAQYWCNPLQKHIWAIPGPLNEIPFTVVARPKT